MEKLINIDDLNQGFPVGDLNNDLNQSTLIICEWQVKTV